MKKILVLEGSPRKGLTKKYADEFCKNFQVCHIRPLYLSDLLYPAARASSSVLNHSSAIVLL